MKIEIDVEQFAKDIKAGKSIGGANGALGLKENKEFLIRILVGTDPLTYDKKFMSDEIYEKVFNSENATQELRRIQYNIYSGLIKDIKNYQQILNDKK